MPFRYQVTIAHPSLGGTGTNTWHVRGAGTAAPEAGLLNAQASVVKDFYADLAGVFPTDTVIACDGVFVGVGPDEGTIIDTIAWSDESSSGGDPLPPATCICVSWRGASGDRSRRGRTFVGPISTSALQSNGTPSASALSVVRGAATAVVAESTGLANGAWGVWSRQEEVFRDFVGSSVANQFAVLRSRRD